MASLGGAAATHRIYSKYDPVALGARAAQYVAGWVAQDPRAVYDVLIVYAGMLHLRALPV